MKMKVMTMCVMAVVCVSLFSPASWGGWVVYQTGLLGPGDMEMDSSGRLTYAHRTTVYPCALNYAVEDGGAWSDQTVASDMTVGTWPIDMVYGPDDEPGIAHVFWSYSGRATARYTYRSGGTWQTERVSSGEGAYTSLAYSPSGNAAMAYLNEDDTGGIWTIDYAERTGTDNWIVETIATARYSAMGHQTSLAFLPGTGQPAISFLYGYDPDDPSYPRAELRYAYRSGDSWLVETVDESSSFVGHYNVMVLDPAGNPAISYYDASNDQLKFARRTGPDTWSTEIVDSEGNVGRFSSLAFTPAGEPAIAYADLTNDGLKYAVLSGGAWNVESISDAPNGYYCKLLFDGAQPAIMFADADENVYLAVPEPAIEPAIEALIDIDPDTLNRKSHGKWITVYITLPDGFDVGTIDTLSIAITSLIGESCDPEYSQLADLSFVPQVGDRDEDGILDLTVKFDCQVLLANLCLGDVSITIEGELTTGELFSGSDSIRIIDHISNESVDPEFEWIMPEEFIADLEESLQPTDDDSVEEAISFMLFEVGGVIGELGSESFNNEESATELANEIEAVFVMLDEGMYIESLAVLEIDILQRTDGCVNIGEPDEDDWVTSIEGQALLYPLVAETIDLLESLI